MSLRSIWISAAACVAAMVMAAPAFGQAAVMKECGAKWQAAKAANRTGNQTWPQFLSKCRADMANSKSSKPAAAPAAARAGNKTFGNAGRPLNRNVPSGRHGPDKLSEAGRREIQRSAGRSATHEDLRRSV